MFRCHRVIPLSEDLPYTEPQMKPPHHSGPGGRGSGQHGKGGHRHHAVGNRPQGSHGPGGRSTGEYGDRHQSGGQRFAMNPHGKAARDESRTGPGARGGESRPQQRFGRDDRRPDNAPSPGHDRPRGKEFCRDGSRHEHAPHRPAPGAAEAPRGTVWLYGTHAIAAALANPARRLRRLLVTEEAEAALSAQIRQPWPVSAERVDRARLDQLLGRDTVHQGVALLADPLAPPALAHALERPGPVIVLDQVSDPRNIGAILRSAAAFGAAAVITQDRNAPEETGALAKAAAGALEKVPFLRAVNIARTLVALKAAGCWVVGLDAGGKPLSGPALGERRVALVVGNEGEGLRRLTRDTCDEIAGIDMPGGTGSGLDSLNVSAATAVALYELNRRT
jgi:23S rRNA (guanosine2251-2'-O)-methyltransferase